ncbi:MAG TPA: SDR family NAD(P)-dependent oxidoreductase, partial [Actinoplanes sp.]|nr:SDR family NAD(P)-dependent oxidoreductase [Actinoplanes sp.]
MDLQLKEKVAVVTGGSAGIGLAIARGLAAEGVHLVLSARDGDRLTAVADTIKTDFGVRAFGVPADIGSPAGTDRLAGAVGELFGGADILINNAGTGSEETILEAPDERWQSYWEL